MEKEQIVRQRILGETYKAIAVGIGVSTTCIWSYLTGATWSGEGPRLLAAVSATQKA